MSLAATWVGLEIIILSEVRERQIWYHFYVDYKKTWDEWIYLQNKLNGLQKQTDGYQTEKVGGG